MIFSKILTFTKNLNKLFFIPIQAQFNIFQYFLHYVYRETFYSVNGRKALEGINQQNQKWNLKNQKYFKGAQNKNGQGETSSDDGLLYEEVICIPIYLKKYFLRRCLLWLLSFDRAYQGSAWNTSLCFIS